MPDDLATGSSAISDCFACVMTMTIATPTDVLKRIVKEWLEVDRLLRLSVKGSLKELDERCSSHCLTQDLAGRVKSSGYIELKAYTKVYSFLSYFRTVEKVSHVRILQALLLTSTLAWGAMICKRSAGVLQWRDESGLSLSGDLKWESHECNEIWAEVKAEIERRWTRSERKAKQEEGEGGLMRAAASTPAQPQLFALVTFAYHYNVFKRLLHTVFLPLLDIHDATTAPLHNASASHSFASRSLIIVAKVVVLGNLDGMKDGLQLAAEMCLTGGRNESGDACDSATRRLISLIPEAIVLAEDCDLCVVRDWVATNMQSLSFKKGEEVGSAFFPDLLRIESEAPAAVIVAAAVSALQECVQAYGRIRDGVSAYCGCSSNPESFSPWCVSFLRQAFYGFIAGLTSFPLMDAVVSAIAVPLWLESCHHALELQLGTQRGKTERRETTLLSSSTSLSLWDGYPSLLFFLSATDASQDHFMSLVSHSLSTYLQAVMMDSDEPEQSDQSPLPSVVVDRCIFFFKMTGIFFESDVAKSFCSSDIEVGLQRSEPLSSVAFRATTDGIRQFFATCEDRAAMTLAYAVDHYVQMLISEQTPLAPQESECEEVIQILLDMAAMLNEPLYFSKLYARLLAPRLMQIYTMKKLEVDSWVISLMQARLNYWDASYCVSLQRDAVDSLQDRRTFCAKAQKPVVSSRASRNGEARTLRLSLSSLSCIQSNYLIRRLYVLPFSRWRPYATVIRSSRSIRKMYERSGWFNEDMVDAILRAENHYDENPVPYEGYGRYNCIQDPLGSSVRNTQEDEDGRSSIARISHSTSSIVAGLSALSSVVQHRSITRGVSVLTGATVAAFSSDAEEAFTMVHSGVLQRPHQRSSSRGSGVSSLDNLHTGNTSRSFFSTASDVPSHIAEKRKVKWSLDCGQLTFTMHSAPLASPDATDCPRSSITINGPPLCFLVLQLLDREERAMNEVALTFSGIISHLPVKVPKPLLSQLLRVLLHHGVVERSQRNQRILYVIAKVFPVKPRKPILVHLECCTPLSPRTSQPLVSPVDAHPSASNSQEVKEMAHKKAVWRGQAIVMREMKKISASVTHQALIDALVTAGEDALSSSSLLKECVDVLLERECIVRDSTGYAISQ